MTTPVNPHDIKAGKYELVALSWDETTSKPGEPYAFRRHVQGDVVSLDVEQARRLVTAGAVVKPGEREWSAAEQARTLADAAQRAYEQAVAKAQPAPEPATPPKK